MILKFKNPDGNWEYVDGVNHPTVSKIKGAVNVTEGANEYHITSEAYLTNDRGQTIERLN